MKRLLGVFRRACDRAGRSQALKQVKQAVRTGDLHVATEITHRLIGTLTRSYSDRIFHARLLLASNNPKSALAILDGMAGSIRTDSHLRLVDEAFWLSITEPKYRWLRAGAGIGQALQLPRVSTVLDVGSGGGQHARLFADAGKTVTCVDLGKSVYYKQQATSESDHIELCLTNFFEWNTSRKFDLVWASHVLEHQPNPNLFLQRCLSLVSDGGFVAITVPPLKHEIVGGHVTLWNAGLLLYQLVLAGNDCSSAVAMNYGYNITVIAPKRPTILPDLSYDSGDVAMLTTYFPAGCEEAFDGRMYGRRMTVQELLGSSAWR